MSELQIDLLNPKSFDIAIEKITNYIDSFSDYQNILLSKIAVRGKQICMEECPVDRGDLQNSITSEVFDDYCVISATSEHAMYVEFGTGVEGRDSYNSPYPPYPYYIDSPYKAEVNGRLGWYTYLNGVPVFVTGQISNPFMYRTAMRLIDEIPKIAEEVFKFKW